MIKSWLACPITRGLDIDDRRITQPRRRIIQEKAFLYKIYQEWYAAIAASLPAATGPVLEFGSEVGCLRHYVLNLISSEGFYCPGLDAVPDGLELPFEGRGLQGIIMLDVLYRLHHEPFRPDVADWEFPHNGPLSGADCALPYVIFVWDRLQFQREFPNWQVRSITSMMPFHTLVLGGVSLRGLMPRYKFGFWQILENIFGRRMDKLAMFAKIVLWRRE